MFQKSFHSEADGNQQKFRLFFIRPNLFVIGSWKSRDKILTQDRSFWFTIFCQIFEHVTEKNQAEKDLQVPMVYDERHTL